MLVPSAARPEVVGTQPTAGRQVCCCPLLPHTQPRGQVQPGPPRGPSTGVRAAGRTQNWNPTSTGHLEQVQVPTFPEQAPPEPQTGPGAAGQIPGCEVSADVLGERARCAGTALSHCRACGPHSHILPTLQVQEPVHLGTPLPRPRPHVANSLRPASTQMPAGPSAHGRGPLSKTSHQPSRLTTALQCTEFSSAAVHGVEQRLRHLQPTCSPCWSSRSSPGCSASHPAPG